MLQKDYLMVFTQNGFVKKLPDGTNNLGEFNLGDNPIQSIKIKNRDSLIVFDSFGSVHKLKVSDVSDTSKNSKGTTLTKYIHIKGEVVSIIPMSIINQEKGCFMFVTKNGMMKKTSCDKFAFRASVLSIVLKDDDKLISAIYSESDIDTIVYTKNGFGIRFSTDDFTETSRMTSGVIGLYLEEGDEVIGFTKVDKNDTHFFVLTKKGLGKLCEIDSLKSTKRRTGNIVKLVHLLPTDSLFYVSPCTKNSSFVLVFKKDTIILKTEELPEQTRNHSGKKIAAVPRGDSIITCIKIQ